MKNKKITVLLCLIFFTLLSFGAAAVAFAQEDSYYVCFSTQNYAVRNANKLVGSGSDEYILSNVSLSSAADFYITDNAGTRWYGLDNKPLSVEKAGFYRYDIKFSPSLVYGEEAIAESEWIATDCHITYRFYTPNQYQVDIDGTKEDLTYNPYHTQYELYYISSVEIEAGKKVSYNGEEHTVTESGYYRILFTPGNTVNGNNYLFDEDGNYGSGSDFSYHIYIEDAPQYFLVFDEKQKTQGDTLEEINGKDSYALIRYEQNIAAAEYRGGEFFAPERDYRIKYSVYEKTASGNYTLIDDDNNEDTSISSLTATDVGWHSFSLISGDRAYVSRIVDEERNFGGIYLAAEENGYCYSENGALDLDPDYRFVLVEDGDDDYNEDYEQYILHYTVSGTMLKGGEYRFYITDGKTKYKDGAEYITVKTAGTYKILFSKEHNYGRGRNFSYFKEDENKQKRELLIGTAQQFIEFAEACSAQADYSVNLAVYLTADIDFSGVEFTPIKIFAGDFHGGYHKLENITLTATGKEISIFSTLTYTATLERLDIVNIELGGRDCDYVGIVGTNYGKVFGVSVSGNVSGRNNVGGVVAMNGRSNTDTGNSTDTVNRATVENCTSSATVGGESNVGSIVGANSGYIYGCSNSGNVSGEKNHASSTVEAIGGVVGYSIGKVYDCSSSGTVSGGDNSRYVGGIVGRCASELYFSINSGSVSAENYAGGIVGYYGVRNTDGGQTQEGDTVSSTNIINYTLNYGAVSAASYSGGIVGYVGGLGSGLGTRVLDIRNSASLGDISVTAGSYVGGIVAYGVGATVTGCMSAGTVSAKGLSGGNYAGGVAGHGADVKYSMSCAVVKGENYVGGIVGYGEGALIGNYANVLLLAGDNSVCVGAIAGDLDDGVFDPNISDGDVQGNYYVGERVGGIKGTDYGENYSYAATHTDENTLASIGALSPLLCKQFDRERWQGGGDTVLYPTPRFFGEVEDCDEFDDEALFESLFKSYANDFSQAALTAANLTYTVTFLEWNKDNGDLYGDDGKVLYDNFDIIFSVREKKGTILESPEMKNAQKNEKGEFIYDGGDARYYASFRTVTVSGPQAVYAEYCELVTTVASSDSSILAEGEFRKGTTVEIVRIGDLFKLEFFFEEEEIEIDEITVKYFVGDRAKRYTVENQDGEILNSTVSGKYIAFDYHGGDYFRLTQKDGGGMPVWAWVLIALSGAAVLGMIAMTTVLLSRKKRSKKDE